MNVNGLRDVSDAANACVPQIFVSVSSEVPGTYCTTGGEASPKEKEKQLYFFF